MTNQLPVYFAIMKPVLPQVCTRYEIRNPVYHLPDIRHAFAQQSLKYCLKSWRSENHTPHYYWLNQSK